MQRVLRHRLLPALSAFLLLAALAILPFGGVASAASQKSVCPNGEGGPNCILVISAPESVVAGQPFTVKVAVTTDGTTVAKSDFCGSKVVVSLDLFEGESFITTYSARASGGIATFTITVTNPDTYSLDAFAGEEGGTCGNTSYQDDFAGFTAISVASGQPIAPCPPDAVCVQTTSGTGSAATLFADAGSFNSAFFEAFDGLGCVTPPTDPNNGVLSFDYTGPSQKTIVIALAPNLVNKGIGQFNICWESTNPFTVDGGGQAVPNGFGLFVGYLPNCSPHASPPCVLFRTGSQHDGAFFGILAGPGDPKAYP